MLVSRQARLWFIRMHIHRQGKKHHMKLPLVWETMPQLHFTHNYEMGKGVYCVCLHFFQDGKACKSSVQDERTCNEFQHLSWQGHSTRLARRGTRATDACVWWWGPLYGARCSSASWLTWPSHSPRLLHFLLCHWLLQDLRNWRSVARQLDWCGFVTWRNTRGSTICVNMLTVRVNLRTTSQITCPGKLNKVNS